MRRRTLERAYFRWLCDIVGANVIGDPCKKYERLLAVLHEIDFSYTMAMDANREEDGTNLRYRYGYEHGVEPVEITAVIDNRPCSILEMMAALALRVEETIMIDEDAGDRTSYWFWYMVDSLGLTDETDDDFDERHVRIAIRHFLDHDYCPDGTGGLFKVDGYSGDMRDIDIWHQMCAFLTSHEW